MSANSTSAVSKMDARDRSRILKILESNWQAHFAVGAAKSLIAIRSWWASGLEMTFVGAVEGVVTYFIGLAIGRISGSGI